MIREFFRNDQTFVKCAQALRAQGARCKLTGLFGSAAAHFVHLYLSGAVDAADAQDAVSPRADAPRRAVYVAPNELAARRMYADFCWLEGDAEQVVYLKPAEYMLYDVEARSSESSYARVAALYWLLTGNWRVLVTSAGVLGQWLPEPKRILQSACVIRPGQLLEIAELTDHCIRIGYERVPQVDGFGQFSVRGDIVDVYPYAAQAPYRVEFFDNEIDSLRQFDVLTQRTTQDAAEMTLLPDRETYIWDDVHASRVRTLLKAELLTERPDSLSARRLAQDIEQIRAMKQFAGYDRYLPYILENCRSLTDYIGAGATVFLENAGACRENLNGSLEEHTRICETLSESTGLPPKTYEILMDGDAALARLEKQTQHLAYLEEFGLPDDAGAAQTAAPGATPGAASAAPGATPSTGTTAAPVAGDAPVFHFTCSMPEASGGNTEILLDTIEKWRKEQYTVLFLAESEGKMQRLIQLMQDRGLHPVRLDRDALRTLQPQPGSLFTANGALQNGFVYRQARVAVLSDGTLFKRETARVRRRLKGKAITSFADMQPGDLVVHDVHGIGRFAAIESVEVDGVRRDYIKILYRDDGVLFVPTHQLDSVQKYIGGEDSAPRLNRLGSSEWSRTTAKVKESLRTYARDLVELYARRSKMKGHAFGADTVWQREFEDAFLYEETDDQLRCIDEIKADMESERPMERLLCGDVGYGKTEVALRAAFKAVCDGKQVAFMAPTTVLVQQHYANFTERFRNFPVTVDYLCRFRTPAQRRQVLEKLAAGRIDILVGTHALIRDAVQFHDLGLAIIDEEQRFGVMHKEKFKREHPGVDLLSLSATPIPRTLHMSLSGIRDISVLEDPPQDRLPVQTYVAEWDPALIRNAIYREMARNGQVFYLYNRVQTMQEKLRQLRDLTPEARIAVAHGQMSERELEDVMQAFYQGEYDVLLCTTIVESGLDMPNVNTIIVEDSDRMGLAQLYQIRGRVGRSARLAYAYITYRRDKTVSEVAEKRLRTIRDFTEFGSGFKIALRDLEIRGAGSVLGERQHGQLAVVGYETYCRLLAEVVEEERSGGAGQPASGENARTHAQTVVDFRVGAYIDSAYIEDEEARLELYQKIARVRTAEDALEITDELIDRYGDVPEPVQNLLRISQIRCAAEACSFSSVVQKPQCVAFMLEEGASLLQKSGGPRGTGQEDGAYRDFTVKYGRRIAMRMSGNTPTLLLYPDPQKKVPILEDVLEFLLDFEKMGRNVYK